MPSITDISKQAKRNRYNIFVDGEFRYAVGANVLADHGFRVGDVLDDSSLGAAKLQDELVRAYDATINFLSYRPRSEQEVKAYLICKQYPVDVRTRVLERLSRAGLLDDLGFARSWVRSRQATKPTPKRVLVWELKNKGVDQLIIDLAVAELEKSADLSAAIKVVVQKARLPKYRDPRKLTQYLLGRGFDYGTVKRALDQNSDINREEQFSEIY